jgi:hypothetical protein
VQQARGSVHQPERVQRRTGWLGVASALLASVGLRTGMGPTLLWQVLLALAVGIFAQVTLWRVAADEMKRKRRNRGGAQDGS